MGRMLVVYYSWSHGNAKKIAEELQKTAGADLACLDTVISYEGGYDAVVKQGNDEVKSGYKPKLKEIACRVADYDVIVVGTPTWWYSMAPAVRTFLSENDFSGKTVIPFATHASWPGRVLLRASSWRASRRAATYAASPLRRTACRSRQRRRAGREAIVRSCCTSEKHIKCGSVCPLCKCRITGDVMGIVYDFARLVNCGAQCPQSGRLCYNKREYASIGRV